MALGLVTGCGLPTPGSAPAVVRDVSGGSTLNGTDVGDVIARPALVLTNTDGRPFDLQRRPAGELTVLFFGYTHCPDLCPTTMADLAAALRKLASRERARVTVAFVTEDPATDIPSVLRTWLDRFDPSFVGLIGGNQVAAQALDALKAPRTEIQSPTPHGHPDGGASPHRHTTGDGRSIEHSGSVYVFAGDRVVVYTGGTTPSQYAEDFAELLSS